MTKQEFKKIENEFKKEQKRWKSLKIGQSVFETGYDFDLFEIIIEEINIDERYRYFNFKEYEFEDTVGKKVPIERLFLFADLINPLNNLFENVAKNIIKKIDSVFNESEKNKGLTDAPYLDYISNYDNVRYYQTQKLGVNFIKFPPKAY